MAEAFGRIHGGTRVDVFSTGSRPSGRVNETAIELMWEVGYDLSKHRSTPPSELPPGEFDVLVSMGCGDACPAVPAARRIEWDIPDPKHMPLSDFRAVRDHLEAEVVSLLASLEA
jgi:protein-tyrosine-phosphatase